VINTLGSSPNITNLLLASSSNEYLFQLSKWCKKFLIKARNRKSLNVAFHANETLTKFLSLPKGSIWCEDLVGGPLDIFFKASEDNVVVEIMEWYSRD